jgi:hypothetical protein
LALLGLLGSVGSENDISAASLKVATTETLGT